VCNRGFASSLPQELAISAVLPATNNAWLTRHTARQRDDRSAADATDGNHTIETKRNAMKPFTTASEEVFGAFRKER